VFRETTDWCFLAAFAFARLLERHVMLERTCVLVVGRVECKIVELGVTPELVSLNDEGRK
jgi:hypothetical protein